MQEIVSKSKCSGCTACKSICPKGAISMIEGYDGFLYPEIDQSKCIDCGLFILRIFRPVAGRISALCFHGSGVCFRLHRHIYLVDLSDHCV